MPSLLEVCQSRLGLHEIAGKHHNQLILDMWKDAGHPEVIDDETAWCSAFMCSSAKAAGLPFPPVNVNPAARSWLTWGVGVSKADAEVGDVVVWARGKPNSGQGHVNCISEVRRSGDSVFVRCIGGNQSDPSGGAVTLTKWTDLSPALGVRRAVAPTVKALREAGSTTIKAADNLESLGYGGALAPPIIAGMDAIVAPTKAVDTKALPDTITWWTSLVDALQGIGKHLVAHPYFLVMLLAGVTLVLWAYKQRRDRLAEHKAGIPIAAEVKALQDPEAA